MDNFVEEIITSPQPELLNLVDKLSDAQLQSIGSRDASKIADPLLRCLNQKSASRIVSVLAPDVIRTMLKYCQIDTLSHFLGVTQPSQLSKVFSRANNELISKLIDAAPSHNLRIGIAKALPVERRKQWLDLVRSMENDVGRTRTLTEEASTSLFDERKRLLGDMEEAIRTREEMLRNLEHEAKIKQDHFAQVAAENRTRLEAWQSEISSKQAEMAQQERVLAARIAEFEEINRKQVQQRIEVKVPEYVAAAVSVLENREALYRKKALQWSVQGVTVLAVAICSAIAISLYGAGVGTSLDTLSWQTLLFVSFKGIVILSVLGLWAKHAFTVSNAYMHEAIKRSDRAHAINFGKLYLEIYGNSVDRKELIDIFENWNIASESAFAKANPAGFEPQIIEKIESALRILDKAKKNTD